MRSGATGPLWAVVMLALHKGRGGTAEPVTAATGDADLCEPCDWTVEDCIAYVNNGTADPAATITAMAGVRHA